MSPAARHPRGRRRFVVVTILTIAVVAFVVVPWVVELLDALSTYSPTGYEPKDFKRGEMQRRLGDAASWTADHLVGLGLFVLLVAVWFLSMSGSGPGGRSR